MCRSFVTLFHLTHYLGVIWKHLWKNEGTLEQSIIMIWSRVPYLKCVKISRSLHILDALPWWKAMASLKMIPRLNSSRGKVKTRWTNGIRAKRESANELTVNTKQTIDALPTYMQHRDDDPYKTKTSLKPFRRLTKETNTFLHGRSTLQGLHMPICSSSYSLTRTVFIDKGILTECEASWMWPTQRVCGL